MCAMQHTIISPTENTISSSGRILMPSVSSSKNLSSPALAAGIGELSFFFFFLLLNLKTSAGQ
jgi:hypothetical protein